jgi:soluble lytic murein transglycosylase-like protein
MLALASIAAAVAAADTGDASAVRRGVAAPPSGPLRTLQSVPAPAPKPRRQAVRCPIPGELRPAFVRAAKVTGLPLALLTSIAHVESQFHPDALSHAGAVGVMQVLPATAAEYGLDVSETSENVLAGARYLDRLLDEMGSADLAIAAYNAGPTVTQATGFAPYAETVRYVADVNEEWRRLNGCA